MRKQAEIADGLLGLSDRGSGVVCVEEVVLRGARSEW